MIQITQKTNVVLLAEVKVLKDQATFYEEEKKEAQMQIAELKAKVNELEMKALVPSQFMQWDQSQIHLWIMSLENGRFKKYASDLMNALTSNDIIGEDLMDVTGLVLKSWGVKDRKDMKSLNAHIERLVRQNKPRSPQTPHSPVETAEIAFSASKADEGAETAYVE